MLVFSVRFGRSCPGNRFIEDIRASSIHFSIQFDGAHLYITDLSRNGVFVNDKRVQQGVLTELHNGDIVSIIFPPKNKLVKEVPCYKVELK